MLIVSYSFGLIERFLNDDNAGISDRMLMLTASIEYFLDLDLLDEQTRKNLGYAKDDEVIIYENN